MKRIILLAGFRQLPSDLQMDPALRKLLKLRLRGRLRQMLRGLKTPRGALFFAIGLAMFVLWLGPSVVMAVVGASARGAHDPEVVRTMIPLALMGLCVLSILGSAQQKGIHFTGAEIDFLFAGPFTRRELLLYKLSGTLVGSFVVALLLCFLFLQYATLWIAAFVGCFLTLVFVQLFSTAIVLIGQTVAEHAYTRTRRLALLIAAGLAAVGLAEATLAATKEGFVDFLVAFRHSWAGTVLLAPVDVFGRAILAKTLVPELAGWGSLALLVDLALLVLVLRLDVNYMEAAIATSQKLYQRMQRARRGGSLAWAVGTRGRVHLPPLPRLGGAGPIVWRQLIHAVRTSRGLLYVLIVMGVWLGFMVMASREERAVPIAAVAGGMAFFTIFLSQMVSFDFRGDLDQMESLKALPLNATAIAAGQLVVPTVALTGLHLLVLALVAALASVSLGTLVVIAIFALPFNFLLIGTENLLFLTFPTRMAPATPGDLQHVGRTMVLFAAKMLLLGACCGLAAAPAVVVYLVCGRSWLAALSVAWLVLAVECAALVPCVAAAYRKFDVSVDTPP